jgi:hypothetical protein
MGCGICSAWTIDHPHLNLEEAQHGVLGPTPQHPDPAVDALDLVDHARAGPAVVVGGHEA